MFVVHYDVVGWSSGLRLMEATPLLAGLPMEVSTEDRLAAIGDRALCDLTFVIMAQDIRSY